MNYARSASCRTALGSAMRSRVAGALRAPSVVGAAARGMGRGLPAAAVAGARPMSSSSAFGTAYKLFYKNNAMYITYILAGCVVVEMVYGKATDTLWEMSNKGKLYHHIDWSKFKDDDEEEEEEDDE